MRRIVGIISCILVLFTGCTGEREEKQILNIPCASSLSVPMEEIKNIYEKSNPNITLQFNFGGSKTLKNQILLGTIPDLFLSASTTDMKDLVQEGKIEEDTVQTLFFNQLAFSSNKESLDKVERIGVANEKLAPLGEYTMEYLRKQPYFSKIEQKIVYANDSGALKQWVLQGEVDVGILYKSDITVEPKLYSLEEIPIKEVSKIQYQVGIGKKEKREEVDKFIQFLTGEQGEKIWEKYGFSTTP